jgi:putative ABC transport system substrate-binding protein
VIVAIGGVSIRAAKGATSTIPIVFLGGGDPVRDGVVASLSRPGGNLTGFSLLVPALTPKRLELLSELVPRAGVIAHLVDPNNPSHEHITRDVQEASRAKGLQLHTLKAGSESEIDVAFANLVQLHAGALLLGSDAFFNTRHEQIVALAARNAIPTIYEWRNYVAAGGLISYGVNAPAAFRQVGIYVGKILSGAKLTDLPVQQPTKFELVVNLKTAKELGLVIPESVLIRADEVIE